MKESLVRGGICSVKKELPRGKKTTRAQRIAFRRQSFAVAAERRVAHAPKVRGASTVSVRHSANGAQCTGAIQFAPHSILNFKPTPIKRGEAISLRPKLKYISPSMVSHEPWRAAKRLMGQKPPTREQRISAAKAKARKASEAA